MKLIMVDSILLTYKKRVTLRQSDLDRLEDGCWLNDVIISIGLEEMVDKLIDPPNRFHYLVLEPTAI